MSKPPKPFRGKPGARPHHRSGPPRGKGGSRGGAPERSGPPDPDAPYWIWGTHAVAAALSNPARKLRRMLATENAVQRLDALPQGVKLEPTDPASLDRLLPEGAVHQGIALFVDPLDGLDLADVLAGEVSRIAVLDQLTDPHNLGAIWRSAAAFGVGAIVLQTRHTPPLGGVAAKAAAGALEIVQEVRVVNIARVLNDLGDAGWNVVGLTGAAEMDISTALDDGRPCAIVLGAEGAGLRPLVEASCTTKARIPMTPGMESLNVSNAAAIAFYEAMRRGKMGA